jgi:hypothetical protein
MAVYQRGNNGYIDFTFHGQRIREMIGPSREVNFYSKSIWKGMG